MTRLAFADHRADPGAWASALGVPREAVELYLACEVIDLHVDSFTWTRLLPGYDLGERHRPRLPASAFLNQVDLPRAREAQMAGVAWDIVTNPFVPARRRAGDTLRHIEAIVATMARFPDDYAVVGNYTQYREARARGLTASFIALQGAQAIDRSLDAFEALPAELVHRITVVHLTRSRVGAPNSQARRADEGLSDFGREVVRRMQARRILVDLSHINRRGFFDAIAEMRPGVPPIVSHTGVKAVRDLWRNVDDEQLRAIADRGGTVGILYHPHFLDDVLVTCALSRVVDHVEHVCRVVGDDFVSLGSDYDGLITLPRELPDITYQPRLVALMLERGFSEARVRKILGENFLRVLREVRP